MIAMVERAAERGIGNRPRCTNRADRIKVAAEAEIRILAHELEIRPARFAGGLATDSNRPLGLEVGW